MKTEKVQVLLSSGELVDLDLWQTLYGLPVGSDKVGHYFALSTDPKLSQDIKDYGQLIVCEPLIRFMDAFRTRIGYPAKINSFNRSDKKQLQLKKRGFRTAEFSPHVVCMAVDLDTTAVDESLHFAQTALKVSKEIGVKIRVGVNHYIEAGQTFIHIDVCPEFYGIGKPKHEEKHPVQWERESVW